MTAALAQNTSTKGLYSPHPGLGFGAPPDPAPASLLSQTSDRPSGRLLLLLRYFSTGAALPHTRWKDRCEVCVYIYLPPPSSVRLLRQAVVVQSVAGRGTSQMCVFNILSRKRSWLGVLEGGVKLTECQTPEWLPTAPGGGGTNRCGGGGGLKNSDVSFWLLVRGFRVGVPRQGR